MPYTNINKSSLHFNTVQYTGNGSTNAITGVGFQPDWVWGKSHTSGYSHQLYDAVRGATEVIRTNGNNTETLSTGLTSFDSDGFTLGSNTNINASGHTVTAWNWKANGQGSSNTDGSINTTYTSANTTSGFSISTYTGTGSVATVGHGLGSVPKTIIIKRLDTTSNWGFYNSSLGATKYLLLNITDAVGTASSIWNDTAPTSSVFTIGTSNDVNASGGTYVAYCFAEKTGFSKFSSFVGTGSPSTAPFCYCGFKPAFLLMKNANDGNKNWVILDNRRSSTGNPSDDILFPNTNDAETTNSSDRQIDFLSNGFRVRASSGQINGNGEKTIYMAFAEAPLVGSNNVPCTAR